MTATDPTATDATATAPTAPTGPTGLTNPTGPAGGSDAGWNASARTAPDELTGAGGSTAATDAEHGIAPVRAATVAEVAATGRAVLDRVGTALVGHLDPLRLALAAVLAGGHVLFEDVPGTGKTLAARSLAAALGLDFKRLQCTPDLLPADVTGSFVYDPARTEFTFNPGPLFAGLLLADEINRTPPKTQSALLEAMQEGQVSVEGRTFALPRPFHVLATANPVEFEGTYPLPEAQLDRFLLRLSFGYPGFAEEGDVLVRRIARRQEAVHVEPVVDAASLRSLQAGVEQVDVDREIVDYCVSLAVATRTHRSVEVGASPRGSAALVLLARALAVLDGRGYVVPDDVKAVAIPALAHRLTLRADTWSTGTTAVAVVEELLARVPGPAVTPRDPAAGTGASGGRDDQARRSAGARGAGAVAPPGHR